jgi:hypothetical protein
MISYDKASELREEKKAIPLTAENDLSIYAAEVGERMWATIRGNQASP